VEQNSGYELEKIYLECEKTKIIMLGTMQNLEKQMATNIVEDSFEVRHVASISLAEAVK
jgi:hypothetical protein